MSENFTLEKEGNLALVGIDSKRDEVNALHVSLLPELEAIIQQVETDDQIKGVIFYSKKKNVFISGADIKMIEDCKNEEEARSISEAGQRIFQKIENLNKISIAAIDGACLGGGLEFALACKYRACTNNLKTIMGLPEVKLGLIPGSGGTKRLPKAIGFAKSLEYMLTGKNIRPNKAKQIGLVDEVIQQYNYLDATKKILNTIERKKTFKLKKNRFKKFIERNYFAKLIIAKQANNTIKKTSNDNFPAPYEIVKTAAIFNSKNQDKIEAEVFGKLVFTKESKALRSIFLKTNKIKKNYIERYELEKIPALESINIIGSGLMGSGIATATIEHSNAKVYIQEENCNSIKRAINHIYEKINKKYQAKHINKLEFYRKKSAIQVITDKKLIKSNIIIEAIPEDIKLKQNLIKSLAEQTGANKVIGSNTSSISITSLAQATPNPEKFIGIHYFSPADKMPLVEIITHDKVSKDTIALAVNLAQQQQKIPIIVKDSSGFYVNRVLGAYIVEAVKVIEEGVCIVDFDKKIKQVGFPVGSFTLLDEVGIDIASSTLKNLQKSFKYSYELKTNMNIMLKKNYLGRKTKKGFYVYGKKKILNKDIYKDLNIHQKIINATESDIERCIYIIINTAAKCLEEKIISTPEEGDIGAIYGFGFPANKGGPFQYMDEIGLDKIIEKLDYLYERFGESFQAAKILIKMKEEGQTFY